MQLFIKALSGMANNVDPNLRLLVKEQSDLGLHCLHMHFVRNFGVGKL